MLNPLAQIEPTGLSGHRNRLLRPNALLRPFGRIDRRLLASIGVVVAIVGTLLLVGNASAINITVTQCVPSSVTQGDSLTCDVTLTVVTGERIPITGFQFDVAGPTPLQATFDPFLNSISSPSKISITASELPASSTQFGYAFGTGYGGGYTFFGGGSGYEYRYQFNANAAT